MRTTTALTAGIGGLALAALVALPASAATGSWTIINTIPPTVSGGQGVEYAGALAVDSTRGLVYLSSFYPGDDLDPDHPNPETSKIFLVDGAAGAVIDTLDLSCVVPGCNDYLAGIDITTDPARDGAWIPYYGSGAVGFVTGGGTGTLVLDDYVDVATSGDPGERDAMPFAVAVDPATGDAYVSDGDDMSRLSPSGSRIYVIDGTTHGVTRYGDDGSFDPSFSVLALDPTTSTLYVPDQQDDYTAVFDYASGLVEQAAIQPDPVWGLNLGTTEAQLDTSIGRLFVTNIGANNIGVYDAATGDPTALLDLDGDTPASIAVDESLHLLVVGTSYNAGENGRLWFFDTRTLALLDLVEMPGQGIQNVGIDPVLGHVYATGFVDTGGLIGMSAFYTLAWRAALPNTGAEPDLGIAVFAGLAIVGGAIVLGERRRTQRG